MWNGPFGRFGAVRKGLECPGRVEYGEARMGGVSKGAAQSGVGVVVLGEERAERPVRLGADWPGSAGQCKAWNGVV